MEILDTHTLLRLDLQRIRKLIGQPEFDKESRDVIVRQLGFHGIVPVLRGLLNSQKFVRIESGTYAGRPVHVLRSRWKRGVLDGRIVLGQPLDSANLPAFVPSICTAWIDKQTGWLYKVEFRGSGPQPPAKKPASKPAGKRSPLLEREAVMVVEFVDPKFDQPVPDAAFRFKPPKNVEVRDLTEIVCQQLEAVLTEARRAKLLRKQQRRAGQTGAASKAAGLQTMPPQNIPGAKPFAPGSKP